MVKMPRRKSRLALLALGLLGLATLATSSACTAAQIAEDQTYVGINQLRAQRGLSPLVPDAQLVQLARYRSLDMAAKGYFSHEPPDGCNFVCLMDRAGVVHAYSGENVAWNTWDWDETAGIAVEMWHDSPPHLENILNCHYTRVGTGVVRAKDGKTYFTMLFEGNAAC